MQIIVEGPDGSGKSTLVKTLASHTGWKVIVGEGPEKEPGEMVTRIKRLLKEAIYRENYSGAPVIYDRHSCVSHPIYSQFTPVTNIPEIFTDQLYDLKNLIIYCRAPGVELTNHVVKEHDTPEHLEAIEKSHREILQAYDSWALKRAHLIYRFWEPEAMNRIIVSIFQLTKEKNQHDGH